MFPRGAARSVQLVHTCPGGNASARECQGVAALEMLLHSGQVERMALSLLVAPLDLQCRLAASRVEPKNGAVACRASGEGCGYSIRDFVRRVKGRMVWW